MSEWISVKDKMPPYGVEVWGALPGCDSSKYIQRPIVNDMKEKLLTNGLLLYPKRISLFVFLFPALAVTVLFLIVVFLRY